MRDSELAALRGPFSLATKARLACEIAVVFPYARMAVRRDDIKSALKRMRGANPPPEPDDADPAARPLIALGQRLGQAVARTMRVLPGDTRCLTQSLVLTRLLARRGIGSTLVLGVTPEGGFSAHAWVEVAGWPVLPERNDVYKRLVEL